MYTEISFEQFEKEFINSPGGYLSVWFSFENPKERPDWEESNESEEIKPKRTILSMYTVVPCRLKDGKINFVEVVISTKEQYKKSVKYLMETQRLLNESLNENFKNGEETIATEIELA